MKYLMAYLAVVVGSFSVVVALASCAPEDQHVSAYARLNSSHAKFCLDGVTYYESAHGDPLIILDENSKIIPCNGTVP